VLDFLTANRIVIVYILTLDIMWTWESVAPYFQTSRNRIRHDLRNLVVGTFNGVVLGAIFASMTHNFTGYISDHRIGLIFLLSPPWWRHCMLAFPPDAPQR